MSLRSRNEITGWLLTGAVVVAGAVTLIVGLLTPVSVGWFAYQPLANATFTPDIGAVTMSRAAFIGLVVLAIGFLIAAFLAGWQLARRETRRRDQPTG